MRRIRDEFGVNMTCGASNVSFGMPGRHALGAAFLPMAMTAGLTSAIMDARTPQIVEAVKAADLLLGHDEWGMAWIAPHRAAKAASRQRAAASRDRRPDEPAGARHLARTRRREGLLAPPGADAAPHDGTGRVELTFAVADGHRRPATVRVPPGVTRLRLRVVERHRDRLHLRRPRHLPQVQGPGRRARRPGLPARRAHLLARPARRRLAAGLPGARRRATSRSTYRR